MAGYHCPCPCHIPIITVCIAIPTPFLLPLPLSPIPLVNIIPVCIAIAIPRSLYVTLPLSGYHAPCHRPRRYHPQLCQRYVDPWPHVQQEVEPRPSFYDAMGSFIAYVPNHECNKDTLSGRSGYGATTSRLPHSPSYHHPWQDWSFISSFPSPPSPVS